MPQFRKLEMDELNRLSNEDFKSATKSRFSFVLDNVRSLQNVGSMFRTGDAFRIDSIFLCGITGQPPHRDIQKTALGSTESVDWKYESDPCKLIDELKANGWLIIGIEQTENSTMLDQFEFSTTSKYAFVLGNEVNGVSQDVLEKCDTVLEIPQIGTKHSLNIAVSAGIIAWEYYSKTKGNTL
ncbi:SpoU rRNA Methylase family protein [Spirosomataceae bacterium TFI 002]|nr:SpoU rRNA Methylase family protein [Spirosomataceae bacterium TFI 002]